MKSRAIKFLLPSVICISLLCFGQESAWDTHIQAGKDAVAKKQYAEAESDFRQALAVAEKFGEKDARYSGALLFVAQACDAQSKQEEAETFAKRGADAMDKALKAHHPKKAEEQLEQADGASYLFDQTGDIFVHYHKYLEGEAMYKKVVQIRESAAEENRHPKNNEDFFRFLGQSLSDAQGKLVLAQEKLGGLYFMENKFGEAATTYEKARRILEENPKTDKRQLSVTLTNLATAYVQQAKYAEAEPLYLRSLALLEQTNWMEKPEAVRTMQNYALLLKKSGREGEAQSMLEKAAAISKKLGQNPQ